MTYSIPAPYVPDPTPPQDGLDPEIRAMIDNLTHKQRIFVESYLAYLDPALAAKEAGYHYPTPKRAGNEMLSKPYIAPVVAALIQDRVSQIHVTRDMIIAEFAKVAFSDIGDFVDCDADCEPQFKLCDVPRHKWAAVKKLKTSKYTTTQGDQTFAVHVEQVELHDKMKALDKLAGLVGMNPPEQIELTGRGGGPLRIEVDAPVDHEPLEEVFVGVVEIEEMRAAGVIIEGEETEIEDL